VQDAIDQSINRPISIAHWVEAGRLEGFACTKEIKKDEKI
jgi:hypothetical protein